MIFEKELSYTIHGIFLKIGKNLGCHFKEYVYQKAFEKELQHYGIDYKVQPRINVYNDYGEIIGIYRPDLIIKEKIIVEIKVQKCLMESSINQLIKYLQSSDYELGYLVNFGTSYIQIIRKIFTNDRKLWRKNIK